jgi:hypothetical protein
MLALLCNPPFALEVARRLQGRLRSDTRRVTCDFTRAGRRAGFGQLRPLAQAIECSVERRLLLRTGPSSRFKPIGSLANVGRQMVKLMAPDPPNVTWP